MLSPNSRATSPWRRFDPTVLFVVVMLVFVAVAVTQFSLAWNGAERGLVLYEQTCPLR